MRCAKQVRAAGVGVDRLEGMGDDLDLRDATGGYTLPLLLCAAIDLAAAGLVLAGRRS